MTRASRAGVLLAATLAPLGSTTIAVALPDIGREVGAGAAALTLALVASYLVVGIAAQGPGGRLGDRYGHGRALRAGLVVHAAGAVVGTLGTTLETLTLARVLMAAGGAVTTPAALALLRNRTPPALRSRAFALHSAALGTAAAVGPFAGGLLVASFGWRSVFAATVPAILAAALLARDDDERHEPALSRTRALPRRGLIDLELLRRPGLAAGATVVSLHNLTMYTLLFALPVAFARSDASSASAAGVALGGLLGAMVLGSLLGGRAAERIGEAAAVALGSAIALGGVVALALAGGPAPGAATIVLLATIGVGLGLASGPAQSAALGSIEPARAGEAAGALSTMRYLGAIAGTGVVALSPALLPATWASSLLLTLAASRGVRSCISTSPRENPGNRTEVQDLPPRVERRMLECKT